MVNNTKPYVIGIDMGGTNTVFGIVDARGVVLTSDSIKTRKHANITDYIDELYTETMRLVKAIDAEDKIYGIGVGAPNANYFTGMIEDGVNLPWPTPVPFAQLLSEKFGIPVAITNDANAAAIGEMTYGVARGLKDFIMITLGTGVGSGIVINGQLVYGHDGFAGELGHVIVKRNNGRLCGCGRAGCLPGQGGGGHWQRGQGGIPGGAGALLENRQNPYAGSVRVAECRRGSVGGAVGDGAKRLTCREEARICPI